MSHPRFSGPRFGGNNLYNKTGGIGTGTGAPGFTQRYANNRHDREGGGNMNVAYDGKRMRNKSVLRKTVDYSAACISFLENRLWQRDFRDRHRLQPDELYIHNLTPPQETIENPMNCVTTRFVRNSMNKLRCPIFCVCWTPEGRRLVTGASSGEFTLWNGLTFSFETILQAHDTSVRCMTWSHNDQWMLTADHGGFVKYWQSNMNNVKMYQAHKEAIRGISFCPTDQKYATCSDDGTVRVWDFIRCHEEKILRGHGADVKCVDWHPQKSLIASGSKDTQQPLKLWDPRMGESLATIHAHKHTVMEVQWNRNGNWLLTASRDHLLKLFDVRNMKEEIQSFKGHKKEATTVAWHPIHEGLFTSGGSDGAILFWLVGNEKEVGAIDEAHETMVWSLAWHPLGHILVSGSNDHSTKFWTRNRPGDAMRDKYNLNTLPQGLAEDMLEYESGTLSTINIPGMGLQTSTSSTDATKKVEVPEPKKEPAAAIPGLDFDAMPNHGGAADKASVRKKIPYAKPVPKEFEKAWSGGAQPPSFRPNKPPPPGPSIPGGPNLNMPNIPGLSGLPFGLNIPGLPELAGILASANPLLPGSQQQDGPDQKPPRQGLLGDGPPSGPPGPPDQRENNGHPDQGPPGMRPPNMGPQGQNMRPPGPNMGPQGQNIRPQNMGGPNMGPGGPNMGPGGPNMGPGGPNMGPGGPNMGPGGPNMGQGGPNMGPGGPNMGQQGQNMGQPPGMNIRPPGPNMRPGGHNMGQQRGQGQFMGGGGNMGPNQDRRQHMQGGMGPGGGNMNQRGNMGPMGGVDSEEFEDMDGGPRGNFGGGRGGGQQGPGGAFNQDEDEEGQQRMEAMNWAGDNTDQSEGGFHGGGGSGGGSRGRRQDWGSDGGGRQHSQERSQSQDRNQEFNRNSSDNANNRKRGHESRYAGWKLDNEDSGDYKFGRGEHNRGGGGGGRGQSSRGQWGGNRGRGGRGGFDGGYKGRGEGGRGRSRGGWRGR